MKWALALVGIAGCGRIGFDDNRFEWSFDMPQDVAFDATQLVLANGAYALAGVDQLDDSAATFGAGTAQASTWHDDTKLFQLDPNAGGGGLFSRVFDAGQTAPWTQLAWITERPSLKPLPDDGSETTYAAGNVDMSAAYFQLHFDDPMGSTTVADSLGHHDGANTGGQLGFAGRFGTAANLINARLDFGIDPALSPSGDFSISLWIHRNAANQSGVESIISKDQNGTAHDGTGFSLYITDDQFELDVGDGTTETGPRSEVHNDTTRWYHVVGTYQPDMQVIYVDGIAEMLTNVAITMARSPNPLIMGNSFNGSTPGNYVIDELTLWNKALSPAEVVELYNRGVVQASLQARSCPDATCAGVPFAGPNNASSQFYTQPAIAAPGAVPISVAPDRFFQYALYFQAPGSVLPAVASVSVGPPHLAMGPAALTLESGVPVSSLFSFSQIVDGDPDAITYQVSADGDTWYYRTGGAWVAAADLTQTSLAREIDAGAGSYVSDVGARLYWRAVFQSPDGVANAALREVAAGFE